MKVKIPAKVIHEITSKKCITKIYDNKNKLIGTLINKKDSCGWSRKPKEFEKKYPDFISEVDGFHCTDVASQLRQFENETHDDLYTSENN